MHAEGHRFDSDILHTLTDRDRKRNAEEDKETKRDRAVDR